MCLQHDAISELFFFLQRRRRNEIFETHDAARGNRHPAPGCPPLCRVSPRCLGRFRARSQGLNGLSVLTAPACCFVLLLLNEFCICVCSLQQSPYFPSNLLSCQVLPMTTHSLQVGQAVNPVFAHRLIPLPDRNSVGTLQQGATRCNMLTGLHVCVTCVPVTLRLAVPPPAPAGGYLRGSDPVEV